MGKWSRFLGLAVLASFLLFKTKIVAQESLPPLKTHPLPPGLQQWRDDGNGGDYFGEIQFTNIGALIWSQFPVKVYIASKGEEWRKVVTQAVEEWNTYLPLEIIEIEGEADIIIEREYPPRKVSIDPETGKLEIPRMRSAQTSYDLYVSDSNPRILSHHMKIQLAPNLPPSSLLAAIRHELGHGLGIWGHSPLETDALYFSQVRNPPPISARDVNTLKKVYQQPTRLGWPAPSPD
ncbi:MAG: hypothetical protein N5P05_002432 [Chroococcopsis gigantea SAG 12.99]|jgi:predicted Zn-dependent protease|nr:hypothetical protein [Chroococcopsis gigantea SAG 12.99]